MEYSYLRLVHSKEGCLYLEKLADDSIECTERCKACGWNKERLIGLIEIIIQELIRVFDVNRENIVNGAYEEILSDVFAHNILKLAKNWKRWKNCILKVLILLPTRGVLVSNG